MRSSRRRGLFVALIVVVTAGALSHCSAGHSPGAARPAGASASSGAGGGQAGARHDAGASSAARAVVDAGPYLSGEARRAHVVDVIERHHDVEGCWSDAVEREPGHAPETFRVSLRVDRDGRAQVDVNGVGDPQLEQCIRVRVAGHRFGPGDEIVVEPDFRLTPGG